MKHSLDETKGLFKRFGERERAFDDRKHDGLATGEHEEPEDKRSGMSGNPRVTGEQLRG